MSTKKNRPAARRIAALVAALGMLAMSSGVALLLTAPSANGAEAKYFVCKYVSTPGEGEVLQTGQNPISVAASAINEDPVVVGSSFADGQGRSYVLVEDTGQPEPPVSDCPPPTPPAPTVISVDVVFVEPTCDNDNTASYSLTGDTADVTVDESASPAPGVEVTVTATAKDGFVFAGDESTYSETHTFDAAADCTVVPPGPTPPVVTPPVVTPPVVSPPIATPTVVHAGIVGDTSKNVRSEQGLALLASGMLLMVAAGGLARPRSARR